ncbi:hypothetical protein [Priestia megaterium]|uniref:hypothetical protein n=1 Tax=Priestia megaterium TaxID=1404 RepID=UPI000BF57714|nr:hypothetical protein [Priestia megaterium]PFW43784.1 hypothetical protein COL17_26615 [Priestia megaterium]
MQGQQVVTCKKCGGNKVEKMAIRGALFIVFLIGSFISLWIPFFGWLIMLPICLIGTVVTGISLFIKSKNVNFKCVECNHYFTVPRETAKQFNEAIK